MPPLIKLIREYLPLTTNVRTNDGRVIPKQILTTLQDATERRNLVVHRGIAPPEPNELNEMLAAVNDFLYALDWLSGHSWALTNMREATRSEWLEPESD
jgi:hypothetical protein